MIPAIPEAFGPGDFVEVIASIDIAAHVLKKDVHVHLRPQRVVLLRSQENGVPAAPSVSVYSMIVQPQLIGPFRRLWSPGIIPCSLPLSSRSPIRERSRRCLRWKGRRTNISLAGLSVLTVTCKCTSVVCFCAPNGGFLPIRG